MSVLNEVMIMELRDDLVNLIPNPNLHPIGRDECFVYYKLSTILAVQGCIIRDVRFKIYPGKDAGRASFVAQVMMYKYKDGIRNELIAVDLFPRHDITDEESLYLCSIAKFTDLIVRYEVSNSTPIGKPIWVAAFHLRCSNGIVSTYVYQL